MKLMSCSQRSQKTARSIFCFRTVFRLTFHANVSTLVFIHIHSLSSFTTVFSLVDCSHPRYAYFRSVNLICYLSEQPF